MQPKFLELPSQKLAYYERAGSRPGMDAAFLPNRAVAIGFKQDVAPDLQLFVSDILRADGNARATLAASIGPDGYQDEAQVVANLQRPLAIFHGAEEQLVSEAYIRCLAMPTLWRQQVQIIPGRAMRPTGSSRERSMRFAVHCWQTR